MTSTLFIDALLISLITAAILYSLGGADKCLHEHERHRRAVHRHPVAQGGRR